MTKDLEHKLAPEELERAINTIAYLEDLYDDTHKYLHKLNRSLNKPMLSFAPAPQTLNMIYNNLENVQTLLIGMRHDSDYLEIKDIMLRRDKK